jgi:hypothetical protein
MKVFAMSRENNKKTCKNKEKVIDICSAKLMKRECYFALHQKLIRVSL